MGYFDREGTNIWLIHVPPQAPPSDWWLCLDQVERGRAAAFRFNEDRWLYVSAHAWLRKMLGMATGLPPDQVCIDQPSCIKPVILSPYTGCAVGPEFNLSHTKGFLAIALSWCSQVGVDVERVRPLADMTSMFSVLHPQERAYLESLPIVDKTIRFFGLWTAKEAYVKLLGHGLSYPFSEFQVESYLNEIRRIKDQDKGAFVHTDTWIPIPDEEEGCIFSVAQHSPFHRLNIKFYGPSDF